MSTTQTSDPRFEQNGQQDHLPDSAPIHRLIGRTRKLLRSSWVATGAGLTVGFFVSTAVAFALLDLMVPLWPWVRVLALAMVVGPAAWVAYTGVLRPLVRRLRDGLVARRIERHLPGIHNRLVSCVDLEGDKRQTVSLAFYRRLINEALERIKSFDPRVVIDFLSLRRAGIFAGASVLALLIAFVLFSDRLPTALARLFAPLADIPPASSIVYQIASPKEKDRPAGDARVLRGDDIVFAVDVTAGEPESLSLELSTDDGEEELTYPLVQREPGVWQFPLTGMEKSFVYRIVGGGTWTREHRVTIVDRPRIAELQAQVHLPAYMDISQPRANPPQVADVTGPVTSQVEVLVRAEGEVAEAEVQMLKPELVTVELTDRPERVWFADKLPEGAAPAGTWEWVVGPQDRPTHTEPPAAGEHQHYFLGDAAGFKVAKEETLFAWVYLDPQSPPETIMLQWNDGSGWEHRAFWGAATLPHGVADTASRRNQGPLPEAGRWTRLEVDAADLGLEGATLRGMGFTLVGGQCHWAAAGALGAKSVQQQQLAVVQTFPMQLGEDSRWAGRFPIERDGQYRVELRNDLGHANQTMKEGQIIAIPDNAPQVVLERPGSDITLNEPAKVPLGVVAYDDFCLKDAVLLVQRGDSGGFIASTLKAFEPGVKSATFSSALDVPAMNLQPGEFIRYRVEIHDRKGQVAATQEYRVTIAQDDNAADRRLAQFEQVQDTFQEKLVQLIAEQAKIDDKVEELEAKYEPLAEAIEKAEEARAKEQPMPEPTAQNPAANPNPAPPPPERKPLELDPESQQLLAELKQELAQLAQQEQQNTALGEQVAAEVQNLANQAQQQQLLPQEVVEQIQAVQEAFQDLAVEPMRDLAAEMQAQAAADPAAPTPDLEQTAAQTEELQNNLEALQERMEALAEATENAQENPEEAIARLEQQLLQQDAGLTARELANLREFLQQQLDELRRLETDEEQVVQAAEAVPENLLDDLESEQDRIEEEAAEEFGETQELRDDERPERMRADPEFPDAPYTPEGEDEFAPPTEEDTAAEEEPNEDADGDQTDEGPMGEEEELTEEEEELFMPALGGPPPKLDPRFEDDVRPIEEDAQEGEEAGEPEAGEQEAGEEEAGDPEQGDPAGERREQLDRRGNRQLARLDLAEQSLNSDQETLERLMQELGQMLDAGRPEGAPEQGEPESGQEEAGQPESGQPESGQPQPGQASGEPSGESPESAAEMPLTPEQAAKLAELMQLPELREALQMAARLRQMRSGGEPSDQASQQPTTPMPSATRSPRGNLRGSPIGPTQGAELADLDPATRTIIMQMQPRVREELLQGMREQGPEGYRQFIQDYFRRLTKVKSE